MYINSASTSRWIGVILETSVRLPLCVKMQTNIQAQCNVIGYRLFIRIAAHLQHNTSESPAALTRPPYPQRAVLHTSSALQSSPVAPFRVRFLFPFPPLSLSSLKSTFAGDTHTTIGSQGPGLAGRDRTGQDTKSMTMTTASIAPANSLNLKLG